MKRFWKTVLFGLALLLITRVSTHLFITKKQEQVSTENVQLEKLSVVPPALQLTQDEHIQGVVNIMNERYPKMGPNGVRIDRVSYVDKIFMFHKTYTEQTVEMFDADELRASLPELRAELCKSTLVDMLRKGAIGIGNHVKDKNGILINSYYATKEDCQKG